MSKLLISGGQPHVRQLLSESLWQEGHQVFNIGDSDLVCEQIKNTLPDLVLLDSDPDEIGTMNISFAIKQKYPDLPVITYKGISHDAVGRIKRAIADALGR